MVWNGIQSEAVYQKKIRAKGKTKHTKTNIVVKF